MSLRRKSPLPPRTHPLRRKTGVRPKNPKRRADEFRRCYHSKERVAWVKGLECCVTVQKDMPFFSHSRSIDNAHVRGDGAGRKSGYEAIIPLCRHHHQILHRMGPGAFESDYNVDLDSLAVRTQDRWLAHVARSRGAENG